MYPPSHPTPATDTPHTNGEHRLVETDIFHHIALLTGLHLSADDLAVLADATDPHPQAERIRCDVVVEVLAVAPVSGSGGSGQGRARTKDPYAALYDGEEEDEGEDEGELR